jgi:hypothetical protein
MSSEWGVCRSCSVLYVVPNALPKNASERGRTGSSYVVSKGLRNEFIVQA